MGVAPETLDCQGVTPFAALPCELIPAYREGDGQTIPLTVTTLIPDFKETLRPP